jgi:hypothetical protein
MGEKNPARPLLRAILSDGQISRSKQVNRLVALMPKNKHSPIALILIGVMVCLFAVPASAASSDIEAAAKACPKLPDVEYWVRDPAKVSKLIDKRYRGNWDRYIDLMKAYQKKMERIFDAEGFAMIKSRDLRLEGDLLAAHIEDVKKRIAALDCLKGKLAGKKTKIKKKRRVKRKKKGEPQEALVKGNGLHLDIKATCEKKAAIFKITNLGEKWPRLGAFVIYRTKGKKQRLKRSLRLTQNQIATFRISGKRNRGQLGLWIEPSWTKRKFRYDLRIYCR